MTLMKMSATSRRHGRRTVDQSVTPRKRGLQMLVTPSKGMQMTRSLMRRPIFNKKLISHFLMAALIGAALAASDKEENGGDASPTSIGCGNDDAKSEEGSTSNGGSETEVSVSFSTKQNAILNSLVERGLLENITKENEDIDGYTGIQENLKAKLRQYPLSNMFVNAHMVIDRFYYYFDVTDEARNLDALDRLREDSRDESHLIDVFRCMMTGFSSDRDLFVNESTIAGQGMFGNRPIKDNELIAFFQVDRKMAGRFTDPDNFAAESGLSPEELLMINTHAFPVDGLQCYGITDDGVETSRRSSVGLQMCNDGNFSHFIHGLAQISAWLDDQAKAGGNVCEYHEEVQRAIGIIWVYRWCNGILKARDRINNTYGFYALMNGGEQIDVGEEICYPYIQLSEAALVKDIMDYMYKNRQWTIKIAGTDEHYERTLVFTSGGQTYQVSMKKAIQDYIVHTNYEVGGVEKPWGLPKCLSDTRAAKYTLDKTGLEKALRNAITVFAARGHKSGLCSWLGARRRDYSKAHGIRRSTRSSSAGSNRRRTSDSMKKRHSALALKLSLLSNKPRVLAPVRET